MATPLVSLERVSKTYQMGPVTVQALRDITLAIHAGE